MMTYDEALAYIHSVSWRGTVPGLERELELLRRIGDPQKKLKYVHIAGTNGKGSTAAMLASVFTQAGYRTGLYTSPFLVRFNERIQVDGVSIPDDELSRLTEMIRPHADAMEDRPTEFETVTAIGFEYFFEKKCDIVVLEVGMGGEWDATNVIGRNEVAVIVNIGLDHTAYLGNTVEEIAKTKSGVVKPGCPCVMYRQQPSVEQVFREVCEEKRAPFFLSEDASLRPRGASLEGQRFDFKEMENLFIPLLGEHQLKNAANVLTVVSVLRGKGWNLPDEAVRKGLAEVSWPGRFQVLMKKPLFIIDGGHNPQCLEALEKTLCQYLPGQKMVFLNGCMADKDYTAMFRLLLPHARSFVTVTPSNPRALSAAELRDYIRDRLHAPATACDTVAEGVREALKQAGPDGIVCACGSLYMLGDIIAEVDRIK